MTDASHIGETVDLALANASAVRPICQENRHAALLLRDETESRDR